MPVVLGRRVATPRREGAAAGGFAAATGRPRSAGGLGRNRDIVRYPGLRPVSAWNPEVGLGMGDAPSWLTIISDVSDTFVLHLSGGQANETWVGDRFASTLLSERPIYILAERAMGRNARQRGLSRLGYGFGISRDQSKPEPGSVFRAGAICS